MILNLFFRFNNKINRELILIIKKMKIIKINNKKFNTNRKYYQIYRQKNKRLKFYKI